jgi:hypothetical protein
MERNEKNGSNDTVGVILDGGREAKADILGTIDGD